MILSNVSFLSAFITTILFHIQGNQWRQPGTVYGWLIILQMSQLDKKHTEGKPGRERQGYLESRFPGLLSIISYYPWEQEAEQLRE